MAGAVTKTLATLLTAMLAPGALAVSEADEEDGLSLSPTSAPPGAIVTATQNVGGLDCPRLLIRWDGDDGPILAEDRVSNPAAELTFEAPAGSPGVHALVAICRSQSGAESVVGRANFELLPPPPPTLTSLAPGVPWKPPETTHPPATTTLPPGPFIPTIPVAPTVTTTPAPPTIPVPAGPPENFGECEQRTRQARANVVYTPDLWMVAGEVYQVVAAVALNPLDPSTVITVGPGRTTVVPLPPAATGCLMEAQLIGTDFDIGPDEPHAQSFTDTNVLVWSWQVKPTRPGTDLRLVLRLQPLFRTEGQPPVPGTGETFEAVIDVDAERRSLPSRVVGWLGDVTSNNLIVWLFLPGGGVITALIWNRLLNRRAAK